MRHLSVALSLKYSEAKAVVVHASRGPYSSVGTARALCGARVMRYDRRWRPADDPLETGMYCPQCVRLSEQEPARATA